MPDEVEYEYVKTTIDKKEETLSMNHNSKLIKEYKYKLPQTTLDFSKIEW